VNVKSRTGFSLVETLISLALLGVVVTSVFGLVVQSQQDYTRQRENMRGQDNLRVADVFIRTVLRSALADPRGTGETLLDPDPRNTNAWNNIRVKSDFNPADGDFDDQLEDLQLHVSGDSLLVRLQAGTAFEVYAYPVRSLKFQYYRANGTEITAEADASLARLVKYTLLALPNPVSMDTLKRTTWVYLRNRR
jgi:prepilin-type N-terminal cleavage/methylation domain-containing protein